MIRGIKKRFADSLCLVVLKQMRHNKKYFVLATLLDLLYLGVIVAIGSFVSAKVPSDQGALLQFFGNTTNLLIFAILYPLLYYLLITLLYSGAKLIMLHLYEGMHKPVQFSFSRFWQFYGLNILVYFSFFGTYFILFSVLGILFERAFLKYLLLAVTPAFVFFLFAIIHITHSSFFHGAQKKVFRNGFSVTFKKIKNYGAFFLWDVVFLGLFYVAFNLVHLLLRYTVFSSPTLVAQLTQPYTSTVSFVSLVFLFLVLGFNRLYFLEADRKHVYS